MGPRIAEWMDGALGAGVLVPDYAVMLAAAVVCGLWLVVTRGEAAGLDGRKVFVSGLVAVACALVGARVHFALLHLPEGGLPGLDLLRFWENGLTSSGAIVGGSVALVLAARWLGLPVLPLLDASAPGVAAALALGRIGCFLAGCCFGTVSGLPWAVRFPEGGSAHAIQVAAGLVAPGEPALPVHPTQLYEAALAAVLVLVLLSRVAGRLPAGGRFALLFTVYPLGRFANELLRGDERGTIGLLSVPQSVSAAVLVSSLLFWLWAFHRRSRRRMAPGLSIDAAPRTSTTGC